MNATNFIAALCLSLLPLLACTESSPTVKIVKKEPVPVPVPVPVYDGVGETTVSQVKASSPNGFYKAGDTLGFEVTFTSPQTLGQDMQATFPLELLARQAEAAYQSGSGSDVWQFTYTVAHGDNTSSYLQYPSGAQLRISAVAGSSTSLRLVDLPEATDAGSLGQQSQIIIDTEAPTPPTNLAFQNSATDNKVIQLIWGPATDLNFAGYNAKLCRGSDCQTDCTAAVLADSNPFSITAADNGTWKSCLQSSDQAGHTSSWVQASPLTILPPTGIKFSSTLYTTPAVAFSWDKHANADNYAYKVCSDAACSIDCSSEQLTSTTSGTASISDRSSAYVCVAAIHKLGTRSDFGISAQSALIDALPPIINIGPNRQAGNSFVLVPTITEASTATYLWSKDSGPGTITFESPNAANTLIDATTEGVYQIRLKVTDAQGRSTEATFQLTWDRSLTLSAYRSHACAIFARGQLKCWGADYSWRNPGTGEPFTSTALPSSPVNVGASRTVTQVGVGSQHVCVLLDNGSVKCWGQNDYGQLGYGDGVSPLTAPNETLDLGAGRTAVSLGVGDRHSCVILDDSSVKCWGGNDIGQLGYGDTVNRSSVPTAVVDLGGSHTAKALAVGLHHNCAVLDDNTVKCWGESSGVGQASNQLTAVPITFASVQQVKKIRSGWAYSCAILNDDTVNCWGSNGGGRLGDRTTSTHLSPVAFTALAGITKDFALGADYACALLTNGTVKCWGDAAMVVGAGRSAFATDCTDGVSESAQCSVAGGANNTHMRDCSNGLSTSPAACTAVGGTWASCSDFTKISAATCVGGTRVWDTSKYGYCSNGTQTATAFCTANGGAMVRLGYCSDNTYLSRVSCLAAGKTWHIYRDPGPVLDFGAGRTVLALTSARANTEFACALLDDMSVKCWGDNSVGQLGYGDGYYTKTFSAPLNLGAAALKVVAGRDFKCALLSGGSVKCWGGNSLGQLGVGDYADRYTPPATPIALAAPAVDIASHHYHSCALLNNNTVQCWGFNNVGQLGNGTSGGQNPNPVTVAGLTDTPTGIAVGREHTCILLAAGNVKCWGLITRGSIGSGATIGANLCSDGVTASASCTGSLVWNSNLHGDCSNGLSKSQAACAARPNGVWAHCSDGIKPTAASCVGGTLAWDAAKYGYCTSSAVTTKAASTFCTDNGGSWLSGIGYCSNPTHKTRLSCLTAGSSWHFSMGPGADVDLGGVGATQIVSSGEYSMCALLITGDLRCWGLNHTGQIGVNDSSGATYFAPGPAVNLGAHSIKSLSSGQDSFCAILDDDSMRCWGGSNAKGQFGHGDTVANYYQPAVTSADFGPSRSVSYVSQTTAHNRCIIASDNTVSCLGDFGITFVSGDKRTSPLDLGTTTQPSQVVITGSAVCVTFIDGSVRCAGDNSIGQASAGLPTYRYLPAATAGFSLN